MGQGGFALERIEKFVVAYDCGSITSNSMVESCTDYASRIIDHVDLLFISHFDEDHVNGIRHLLSKVRVRTAIVSWIAPELRYVYGVYTNGAYSTMMDILKENEVEVTHVGAQDMEQSSFIHNDIWEWIAKSMLTPDDFDKIKKFIQNKDISLPKLETDLKYLEEKKEDINDAFKKAFGSKGPNSKGLIVLSQRCQEKPEISTSLYELSYCFCHCKKIVKEEKETSCLYVGDADLKNGKKNAIVKDFVRRNLKEKQLFLMQIPHHGSFYNIGANFENDYPARMYFLNDDNTDRLQKSKKIYQSLTSQDKLIVARVRFDLIVTQTDLQHR